MNASLAKKALENFVQCVEATGGVVRDKKGYVAPVADQDWIDLGDSYLLACQALGRTPVEKPEGALCDDTE